MARDGVVGQIQLLVILDTAVAVIIAIVVVAGVGGREYTGVEGCIAISERATLYHFHSGVVIVLPGLITTAAHATPHSRAPNRTFHGTFGFAHGTFHGPPGYVHHLS